MADIDMMVIAGSPGAGKSTLCGVLQTLLHAPYLEFSNLRQPHLDETWSNASPEEEDMAFENLVFAVNNYLKHGYRPVIITDLLDARVGKVDKSFAHLDYRIYTLFLQQEEEIRSRIAARTEGFTNVDRALAWNRHVQARPSFPNEQKIMAENRTPEELAEEIIEQMHV